MKLRRYLGTFTLTVYGVGVMVGAGIFVLVGRIVALSGPAAWMAFAGSALAALPTALSYTELSSRYPYSAGESVFADRAFGRAWLSFLVGYLVLASGVASTATVSHGFANYLGNLVAATVPWRPIVIAGFLGALSALNHRGIAEATWINVVCTVSSVGTLVVITMAGLPRWGAVDLFEVASPSGQSVTGTPAVIASVALAFYAYIGFEDLCNVAEEAREPSRTIPRAILLALALSTVIYVGVAVTAVSTVPPSELAGSRVPLVLVAERLLPASVAGWLPVVALLAVTNTALFNLIMSSRILYGMGRNGWVPELFSSVHPHRRTPTWGVMAAFVLATLFALTGVLSVLAEATNAILLTAFFVVNLSLIVIRRKSVPPDRPEEVVFRVPSFVPYVGLIATGFLATRFSGGAYLRAAALVALGAILYAVQWRLRRSPSPEG